MLGQITNPQAPTMKHNYILNLRSIYVGSIYSCHLNLRLNIFTSANYCDQNVYKPQALRDVDAILNEDRVDGHK